MNILLTNFHPGNGGGHTTYLNYLFKSFLSSEQIDNVYIAAPKKSRVNRDIKKTYPSKVFDIDFPGKLKDIVKIFDSAKKLEKIISKYGIDLVHVNGTPDHKVIMLYKLLYRLNFQIIRTKHDSSNIKIN